MRRSCGQVGAQVWRVQYPLRSPSRGRFRRSAADLYCPPGMDVPWTLVIPGGTGDGSAQPRSRGDGAPGRGRGPSSTTPASGAKVSMARSLSCASWASVRGALYFGARLAKRAMASSVAGVYRFTRLPSGSRKRIDRFPHGRRVGSCTQVSMDALRRSYSASTSST
jgi:hypothetical protein